MFDHNPSDENSTAGTDEPSRRQFLQTGTALGAAWMLPRPVARAAASTSPELAKYVQPLPIPEAKAWLRLVGRSGGPSLEYGPEPLEHGAGGLLPRFIGTVELRVGRLLPSHLRLERLDPGSLRADLLAKQCIRLPEMRHRRASTRFRRNGSRELPLGRNCSRSSPASVVRVDISSGLRYRDAQRRGS